jgi:hypothetical protein
MEHETGLGQETGEEPSHGIVEGAPLNEFVDVDLA